MTQVSQDKYLSVKALTQYIKRKFDVDPYMQRVYVVGEISSYRKRANSHQYFSLKDNDAKINVTLFKSQLSKLDFELEEGMRVFATGKITVYEPDGRYQLVIDSLQPDGVGALYQALSQRIEKFRQQGLFEKLQRPLVRFPKKIAVVTSPSGAVIQDILTTIQRRYPIVKLVVFPTRVQGKEAVGEIIDAFDRVYQQAEEFDTIILARGGGSIEDLWCFNDETLALKILESPIPIISSIGHETDTTLSDLVADLRAATPTAAAEMAVPVLQDLLLNLSKQRERLYHAVQGQLNHKKNRLSRVKTSYILQQPDRLYQTYSQHLDHLNQRLIQQIGQRVKQENYTLGNLNQRLLRQHPGQAIQKAKQDLTYLRQGLVHHMNSYMTKQQTVFSQTMVKLDGLSPLKILSRGYAFVESEGKVVQSVEQVKQGQVISVRMADGQMTSQVMDIIKEENQNGSK